MGDEHLYLPQVLIRWGRVAIRLRARGEWPWQGLLSWLLRRPQFRHWVLPRPGTESVESYMR